MPSLFRRRAGWLLLASVLLLPRLAAQSVHTYSGCGPQFGSCASVTLSATPLENGEWHVVVAVSNISPSSVGATIIRGWGVSGPGTGSPTNPYIITDGAGVDQGFGFVPSAGPGGTFGFDGYNESSILDPTDPDGGLYVNWVRYSGAWSSTCAADPACAATRAPNETGYLGAQIEYFYLPGPVVFDIHFTSFNPDTYDVWVSSQGFTSGAPGYEEFQLSPATTVTPEPLTLSLLATGMAGMGLVRRRVRRA